MDARKMPLDETVYDIVCVHVVGFFCAMVGPKAEKILRMHAPLLHDLFQFLEIENFLVGKGGETSAPTLSRVRERGQ